ncbi:hypothetical protein [Loktanella salsilacus]|uniref:hypothetical protein n=1 Tax=Loktanella salsilacus TaxID=195913 RepID=UPI003736F6A7
MNSILRHFGQVLIWFGIITVIIAMYADQISPFPVSIWHRFLIAAGIVVFINLPWVKAIGRIYLRTSPDDGDLDD